MNIVYHTFNNAVIAEATDTGLLVQKEQDSTALIESLFESGTHKLILHVENLAPEFFQLRTGLAGAVLQKFVTYHLQVAIVGDFSNFTSEALKAFIYESNQGTQVFFLDGVDQALTKLVSI